MMFVIIILVFFIGVVVGWVWLWFIVVFVIFWLFLVYYLLVYMVWGGGIFGKLGMFDFVGGIVVYINVGVMVLVFFWMVGLCL